MAPNREHDKWVAEQFERPRWQYRDVILHAAFIEGTVCSKSTRKRKQDNFKLDIQWLCDKDKLINEDERAAFHKVRETRNALAHRILKQRATEQQIIQWRDDLKEHILAAYRISPFLDKELFKKYKIDRTSNRGKRGQPPNKRGHGSIQ
ncbi:MAG: hypothetical protein M1376_13510 [Planctomycetes bacterium]|nr:hypothetical protein [Planctomycetota bacterium]